MKRYIVLMLLLLPGCLWAQNWSNVGPFAPNTTTHSSSLFATERVQCIAYNPFDNDSMYVGSKGGIWISPDKGVDWTEMDLSNQITMFSGANSIIVGPVSHHVYVATTDIDDGISDSRIWTFNNSTSTWSHLNSITTSDVEIYNIKFYPNSESTIYACTNIGLFISYNGGNTWAQDLTVMPSTGSVYNIAFATLGTTTYTYISGNGIFEEATDGHTFNYPSAGTAYDMFYNSSTGLFVNFSNALGNICVGNVSSGSFDIYFYAGCFNIDPGESAAGYHLIKYTNTGSSESAVNECTPYHEYDNNPDRLALGYIGSNKLLFFGGVNIKCINTQYSASVITSNPHTDNHYVLDVPGNSTVYEANDGGLCSYGYTGYIYPSSHPSFSQSSNGLDIAQVAGFSGAGANTNLFVTGELDRNGKVYDFSNPNEVVNGGVWENDGGIINKTGDLVIMNPNSYVTPYIYALNNGGTSFSGDEDDWLPITYPLSSTIQADVSNISGYSYCPGGSCSCSSPLSDVENWCGEPSPSHFGNNPFYQDPSRTNVIYYMTTNLYQWDPLNNKFVMKLSPLHLFPGCSYPSSSTSCITWNNAVSSVAASAINKNGFCITTASVNSAEYQIQAASQVIKFAGPNIDDTWDGHNDDLSHWHIITPNFSIYNGAPWYYTFTDNDIFNININSSVISSWDSGKIWVGCNPTPKYPLIKVLKYDHCIWTDYSAGIPSTEVVESMVMEVGSNDGIYLSTNRAVYYRNASMSSWQSFNNSTLPELKIPQIEINYYVNQLRAGTYGRGIWESSLECPQWNTEYYTYTPLYPGATEFDEVNQYITSTANVAVSTTLPDGAPSGLYYRAGEYVSLQPGFHAVSGSDFYAFIHPCSGSGNSIIDKPQKGGATTSGVDAVKNIQEEYKMDVYPNPNNGSFTVRLPDDELSDVHVYSLMGTEIYVKSELKDQVQIDLSNQPKGIYFVKAINTKTGETIVKKLVIQ